MLGVQMPLTVPFASSTGPAITLPSIVHVAVCVPPLSVNEPLRLIVEPNGYDVSNAGPTLVAAGAWVSGGMVNPGVLTPGSWPAPGVWSSVPMILGIGWPPVAAAATATAHAMDAATRMLVTMRFIFQSPSCGLRDANGVANSYV